jgi:threonine 3-dehydrogenase
MRARYGKENVILSDIKKPMESIVEKGPYIYADVLDLKHLHSIVVNYGIDWVVHFSAVLSAAGEALPQNALNVNVTGFHNIIEVCKNHKLKLFCPSTVGAFGPESPKIMCPEVTIMRPKTIYGISKVHMEHLLEYYSEQGLDFRTLRFPGVIRADTPRGSPTDYAVHIFHEVARTGHYKCFLKKDTRLPMIYINDCLEAVIQFMEIPLEQLSLRTYNLTAMSFTPEKLVDEMKEYYPNMTVDYCPDPVKQRIADSWPSSLDDSRARSDWQWEPQYDLKKMTQVMVEKITQQINKQNTF